MLQVFLGNDRESARASAEKAFSALILKRKEAEVILFDADSWDVEKMKALVGAQGLFEKKYIVRITYALDTKLKAEEFESLIEECAESENAFVVLEEKLSSAQKKKCQKHAYTFEEYTEKKEEQRINVFGLADAFGNKDKRNFWVLYTQCIRAHIPPEEIHGILLWQVKGIIATYKTDSAQDAGMKDFSYKKAKRFAQNYSLIEITHIYDTLIDMYHNAHKGKYDLSIALERFVLGV